MRESAGNRRIDAALDARAPTSVPPGETADQTRRRKLRQAKARARSYLNQLRKSPA